VKSREFLETNPEESFKSQDVCWHGGDCEPLIRYPQAINLCDTLEYTACKDETMIIGTDPNTTEGRNQVNPTGT
jgi:hypothetical protein